MGYHAGMSERKGSMESTDYNPNRSESILIKFRDPQGPRRELEFSLPSKLALPFHWWMMVQGIKKV